MISNWSGRGYLHQKSRVMRFIKLDSRNLIFRFTQKFVFQQKNRFNLAKKSLTLEQSIIANFNYTSKLKFFLWELQNQNPSYYISKIHKKRS